MKFRWFQKRAEPSPLDRIADAIPQVLAAYGALMERHPTAILDTLMLPLPKASMKLVFKTAWMADSDTNKRNALELAFVGLSNFQDGVGDNPIDCKLPANADPTKVAEILAPWLSYSIRVNTEAAALLTEFQEFKNSNV